MYIMQGANQDVLLIEVHDDPAAALSDGFQSITPGQFAGVVAGLRPILRATGRDLQVHPSPARQRDIAARVC